MTSDTEGHVARLLLLVDAFSDKADSSLDGLTKLAKLDFLIRYPVFLETLSRREGKPGGGSDVQPSPEERAAVESPMVRYKYGPWDDRYYSLIGALIGRGLVEYVPGRGRAAFRTTEAGHVAASALREIPVWIRIAERVRFVRGNFDIPGTHLKTLIYEAFPGLVAQDLRTTIDAAPVGDL